MRRHVDSFHPTRECHTVVIEHAAITLVNTKETLNCDVASVRTRFWKLREKEFEKLQILTQTMYMLADIWALSNSTTCVMVPT
jgi:hypothetical protein